MRESEKHPTGLLHSGDKLRQLLLEHPDLPLIVFATDEANSGDYSAMSCGSICCEVGEFLDCQQDVNDERCYTDRDDFVDAIYDAIEWKWDGSEKELEQEVERRADEYEPYWKPCIILTVGN